MSPVVVIVFIVVAVLLVGGSFFRLRKGGPGPNTGWLPRSMRGRVNKEYKEHGWEPPYDDHGDRASDRKPF